MRSRFADRLISAVGDREQTPTQIDAADRRHRAFSLFVKAYDQARRAFRYVRWEQGDADSIAPSLYSGRGNSNVKGRAIAGRRERQRRELDASAHPGFARRCLFHRLVTPAKGTRNTMPFGRVFPCSSST